MSYAEYMALLPVIILTASVLVTMLSISIHRSHLLTAILSISGLVLATGSLLATATVLPQKVTALLILDNYAFFFMGLIFGATIAIVLLSYRYLDNRRVVREEFYLLLLLASLGASVLVASSHFVSFVLGLEILSVSLYALLAYLKTDQRGLEAALKYLILAAVSSAFLLFGMALVYAQFGSMEFAEFAMPTTGTKPDGPMLLAGTIMIISGIGFKLAVVPFHMWSPDVYEGAPAPVTAFVATVSKGAVFGLLLRYFNRPDTALNGSLFAIFSAIAIASMFIGNLLALFQRNVKRILAYSSIAHLGYLLVAFLAGGPLRVISVTFYLVAYFVTTLAALGVVIVLSDVDGEADTLEHYRSLAWNRPWTAGIFTAALLSLAGIPLTAGFLGKFYVLSVGIHSSLWLLAIMLVINSAIGLFYYLRIIRVMFVGPEEERRDVRDIAVSPWSVGDTVLAVLILVLMWLGIYPGPAIGILSHLGIFR